jgi:hypothetical protein
MKAIICDIDGTVADCRHRLHHVLPGGKRNWDAFFATMADDTPIQPVIDALFSFARAGHAIVMCSGRPERYRKITEDWLTYSYVPFSRLYMRPDDDTRPDHIVKAQIFRGILEDGYEPLLVIDDRQSVVDMWRDNGLVCLQAAPSVEPYPASAGLTLLVGPSGAGKSTYAKRYPARWVISSDEIREDLCGDARDQSRNTEVFQAMRGMIKARLRAGLHTVVDATHLRRRDRLDHVELAQGCPVEYVVLNRSVDAKRASGGWRNAVIKDGKPFDLIGWYEQRFQSQLRDILAGDNMPNVTVTDLRWDAPKNAEREAA